jgi:hypothetical protein
LPMAQVVLAQTVISLRSGAILPIVFGQSICCTCLEAE